MRMIRIVFVERHSDGEKSMRRQFLKLLLYDFMIIKINSKCVYAGLRV